MARVVDVRLAIVAAFAMLMLAGCRLVDRAYTPTAPTELALVKSEAQGVGRSVVTDLANDLPAWIVEPSTLPDGRVGENNCTFQLPASYQWDAHSEGGCWEHAGPDGWTRQQFQRVHIPSFASCGGGPGDATAIRVCRAGGQGQPSPCSIDPFTGPNGCARCVINPMCH